ncbi:hypothetical protein Droror1_Dr00004838 [Drosera rotundifolia]
MAVPSGLPHRPPPNAVISSPITGSNYVHHDRRYHAPPSSHRTSPHAGFVHPRIPDSPGSKVASPGIKCVGENAGEENHPTWTAGESTGVSSAAGESSLGRQEELHHLPGPGSRLREPTHLGLELLRVGERG